MSENKIRLGSEVRFTEDDWLDTHYGVVKDITLLSYYVSSKTYGDFYIPKCDVMLKDAPLSDRELLAAAERRGWEGFSIKNIDLLRTLLK